MGMIPVGMIAHQTEYYQQIGSRKSGRKWGLDLVQKMVRATNGLWMERNNLLHLRAANGIRGLCNIALQTALSVQVQLPFADRSSTHVDSRDWGNDPVSP